MSGSVSVPSNSGNRHGNPLRQGGLLLTPVRRRRKLSTERCCIDAEVAQ